MLDRTVILQVPLPNSIMASAPYSPLTIDATEPPEIQMPVTINIVTQAVNAINSPDFVKITQGEPLNYQWLQSDTILPVLSSDGNISPVNAARGITTLKKVTSVGEIKFDNRRNITGDIQLPTNWYIDGRIDAPVGIEGDIITPQFVNDGLAAIPTNVTAAIDLTTLRIDGNVVVARAFYGQSDLNSLICDGAGTVPNAIVDGSITPALKTRARINVSRNLNGKCEIPNTFISDGDIKQHRIINYNTKTPACVSDGLISVPIVLNADIIAISCRSSGMIGVPSLFKGDNHLSNKWKSKGSFDYVKRFEGHTMTPTFISKGLIGLPTRVKGYVVAQPLIAKGVLRLTDYINATIELSKIQSDGLISDDMSGSVANITIGSDNTFIVGNGVKF